MEKSTHIYYYWRIYSATELLRYTSICMNTNIHRSEIELLFSPLFSIQLWSFCLGFRPTVALIIVGMKFLCMKCNYLAPASKCSYVCLAVCFSKHVCSCGFVGYVHTCIRVHAYTIEGRTRMKQFDDCDSLKYSDYDMRTT